jgi:hypothetical protein
MKLCVWLTLAFILTIGVPARIFAVGAYHVTYLGTLPDGATYVLGNDINSRGQVVGQHYRGLGPIFRGFLWSPTTPNSISGSMGELPPYGGTAINDFGQVAVRNASTGISLWTPETANSTTGSSVTISLGDSATGFPSGINSNGQIAGLIDGYHG